MTFNLSDDVIDVRSLIDAFEATDSVDEINRISPVLNELENESFDHEWEGRSYPLYLIRYSHMVEYAKGWAEEIYGKDISEAKWPFTCIDWNAATEEFKLDYRTLYVDEVLYFYR